jgi:hypothetical protein
VACQNEQKQDAACIVLQCGHHYLSMFLTISQPPDLTTEPATWYFNMAEEPKLPRRLLSVENHVTVLRLVRGPTSACLGSALRDRIL